MVGVQSIWCLVGVSSVYQGGALLFTQKGVQDGGGVWLVRLNTAPSFTICVDRGFVSEGNPPMFNKPVVKQHLHLAR